MVNFLLQNDFFLAPILEITCYPRVIFALIEGRTNPDWLELGTKNRNQSFDWLRFQQNLIDLLLTDYTQT